MSAAHLSEGQFAKAKQALAAKVAENVTKYGNDAWDTPIEMRMHPDHIGETEVPDGNLVHVAPLDMDRHYTEHPQRAEFSAWMGSSTDPEILEPHMDEIVDASQDYENVGAENNSSSIPAIRVTHSPTGKGEGETEREVRLKAAGGHNVRYAPMRYYPDTEKGNSDHVLDML